MTAAMHLPPGPRWPLPVQGLAYAWVPFGGGTRRCLGAAFANMEMNVVPRTLLREFRFVPTASRPERLHNRGVAFAPKDGGRAVVYRRIHSGVEGRAKNLQSASSR